MKKPHIPVLITTIIVLIAIGAMFLYARQVKLEKVQEQQKKTAAVAAEQKAQAQKAQDLLNEFLTSVNKLGQDYKAERKMVIELVSPENLSDPSYVEENYSMMEKSLPELQARMDRIMALFRDTETKMRETVAAYPPAARKNVMDAWRKVRDEQADVYLAFFDSEQDLLKAYQNLMQFYKDKKGEFTFDRSTGGLIFSQSADKAQEEELRQQIDDLAMAQQQALKAAKAQRNNGG